MINNRTFYESKTYNALQAALFALPGFISLVAISMLIARLMHSEGLAVIGWILSCSLPFLFKRQFMNLFTRRVELEFDDQNFIISQYHIRTNVLLKRIDILWDEIEAYKCSFSSSNLTYLVLYLKGGRKKHFSFKEEKDQEKSLNEKSVFSIFYYYVTLYNKRIDTDEKIMLGPNFLSTKMGSFIIYFLSILELLIMILLIYKVPKSFILSLIGGFIILGLLVKRTTDKALYKKINHLEPQLLR